MGNSFYLFNTMNDESKNVNYCIQGQKCEDENPDLQTKPYFKWSHVSTANYLEPTEMTHVCKTENYNTDGDCVFPQDNKYGYVG